MKKNLRMAGISAVMCGTFLLSPMYAGAEGTGDLNVMTEDVKTYEQKKAEKEKEKLLKEYSKQKRENQDSEYPSAVAGGFKKVISVPSYEQQTNYWCGPATVKQVLHYFNGTSYVQNTYAGFLGTTTAGTDFSKIDELLNNYQKDNTFIYKNIGTYADWSDSIEVNLQYNYPTVLDLTISPSYMPKYTTNIAGHILNVSGSDTTVATPVIRLTDPFDQGNRGVTLGNVWHPHKGVYNANNAHFRKAMIW